MGAQQHAKASLHNAGDDDAHELAYAATRPRLICGPVAPAAERTPPCAGRGRWNPRPRLVHPDSAEGWLNDLQYGHDFTQKYLRFLGQQALYQARFAFLRRLPYPLSMLLEPEDLIASLDPKLLRLFHTEIQSAVDKLSVVEKMLNVAPTMKARQTLGSLRRELVLGGVLRQGAPLGVDLVAANRHMKPIALQEELVGVDLIRANGVYLWLTRVREDGRFAVGPSVPVRTFAALSSIVRPLWTMPGAPILLALFYKLDQSRTTVERVGIGLPGPRFDRIAYEVVGDCLRLAAQREGQAAVFTRPEGEARHGVVFKQPQATESQVVGEEEDSKN